MTSPKDPSLVTVAVREIILGKRGLIKVNLLWLPLATYLSFVQPEGGQDRVLLFSLIFLSISCWALGNILANDLCDFQADLEAGKQRWICTLRTQVGRAIVALIFAVGLGIQFFEGSWQSPCSYAGAMAFGLGYSIKPICFKERGAWGVLAYSLACALAYAAVPFFWTKPELIWLLILFPVVLLDKWVNLHFHQILDCDADSSRGINTLAVHSGQATARKWLTILSSLGSILFVLVFLHIARQISDWFVALCLLGGAVLAVILFFTRASKSRSYESSSLVQELPWFYLGTTLALFRLLPGILFFRLAFLDNRMWIVFAVVIFLLGLESLYNLRYQYE
ncbi:UbiA family prenyltransferase [Acidobacteriota bacterium]